MNNDLKEQWEYIKSTKYIPLKRLKRDYKKDRINKLKFEYIKYIFLCLITLRISNIKSFFNFVNYYEDKKVKDWEIMRDNFLKTNEDWYLYV